MLTNNNNNSNFSRSLGIRDLVPGMSPRPRVTQLPTPSQVLPSKSHNRARKHDINTQTQVEGMPHESQNYMTGPEMTTQTNAKGFSGPRMKSGTKKKRKKKREKEEPNAPVFVPRGGRPKRDQDEPVRTPHIPQGQVPYRDGPRVSTNSFTMGLVGELSQLPQTEDDQDNSADSIGNARVQLQVIQPKFFPQHAGFTTNNNVLWDDTHTKVFALIVNGMSASYARKFAINTTFMELFTTANLLIYFHDTYKLFAELVCLLQRAAYYQDSGREMENPLLANIGRLLNTERMDTIRNRMANGLAFQFLPQLIIDQTFELFQTYRYDPQVTSTATVFITPNMHQLLTSVSVAASNGVVDEAIDVYSQHIDKMIDAVADRPARSTTGEDVSIQMNRVITTLTENSVSAVTYNFIPNFDDGKGGLSSTDRRNINGFLDRIRNEHNLKSLSHIERGNSESGYDAGFIDMFNNTPLYYYLKEYKRCFDVTAKQGQSTIYVSETRSDEIKYKDVQLLTGMYSGCSPLLFYISINANRRDAIGSRSNDQSRYWLRDKARNVALDDNVDLKFNLIGGRVNFSSSAGYNSEPFVQDNYVTKVFYRGTSGSGNADLAVSNPDGNSTSKYYFTKGRLTEMQRTEGLRLFGM